jgi:hypothetical protein
MDLIETWSDGNEHLLASGLTVCEVNEVLDWWRYTKPIGPSVKILVREHSESAVRVTTTGTDVETILPLPDLTHSETLTDQDGPKIGETV